MKEQFFTRAAANEGIRLPLYTPAGSKTEHWLQIRGVDSDVFRLAETEAKRNAFTISAVENPDERMSAMHDAKLRLLASLVMAWSFEEPCTVDAVMSFFREAPQIADSVDSAASRRALFFVPRSSNSPDGQKANSSST